MMSSVPMDESAFRAKAMLEAEDYAGAASESSCALDSSLPTLANVSLVRGRALLYPLLDQMASADGTVRMAQLAQMDPEAFKPAWDAFKLAFMMDPENRQAGLELERLSQIMQRLPRSSEYGETLEIEEGESAVEEGE